MKTRIALATMFLAIAGASSSNAQVRGISGNGFDSGGINIKPKEQTKTIKKTVKTIQHIAVSPARMWKSSDAEKPPITGELLAFKHDKKNGRVSIVEDEKVRLLVNKKKVYTLALEKLSADDQTYVRQLVDSARIAGKLIEQPEEDQQPAAHDEKRTQKPPATEPSTALKPEKQE